MTGRYVIARADYSRGAFLARLVGTKVEILRQGRIIRVTAEAKSNVDALWSLDSRLEISIQ